MRNKIGLIIAKYGITFVAGLLLAYMVMDFKEYSMVTEEALKLKILADAFTVPGVLFVMFSAMLWVSSQGALDGISYALGLAFRALIPGARTKEDETYYDYIQRKRANRKGGYGFLCVVGFVLILIAVYFIYKYYQL